MSTMTIEAYQSADKKTKARIRADVNNAMHAAVRNADFSRAAYMSDLLDAIRALSAASSGSTFDVHAAASDLAATYEAVALWLRLNGANEPGEVNAKRFDALAKLPTRKADRGSVVGWIESVVDEVPVSIADLRKRWVATADYPDEAPSSGAIGAACDRLVAGADYDFVVIEGKPRQVMAG